MPYIVDQTVFHAEGAVISWTAAAQRLNIPVWAPLPTVIELRWMLSADLGMLTEPFTVWRASTRLGRPGNRSRSRSSSSCSSDAPSS